MVGAADLEAAVLEVAAAVAISEEAEEVDLEDPAEVTVMLAAVEEG